MSNPILPPIPYQSPLTDSQGHMTPAWTKWFNQLYQRTGQANAPSNNQIALNPMTALGDTIYGASGGNEAALSGNTSSTKKFLTQTGTGVVSAVPSWGTVTPSDISGTLGISGGGTGQTTQQTAIDALTGTQTSGKYLRSDGTHATLSSIQGADVPTLNQNTTGTSSNVTGTVAIANGGTGQTAKTAAFDALQPMTTGGDIIYGGASGTGTRLANGSSGQVLTSNGTTLAPSWQTPGAATIQVAVFNDTKTSGTSGGTFTSGAWQTRTLNTTQSSQSWASLGSNQVTLSAGTYEIEASGTARYTDLHQTRWQNVTDSTTTIYGTSEQSGNSGVNATTSRSFVVGTFTIGGSKTFELQHQCQTTRASDGFGIASSFGGSEIYAIVKLTKVG